MDSMMDPFFTTSYGALFSADCLDVLGKMRNAEIDTVFADPPFNLGKDYRNGYDDKEDPQKYLAWCRRWILECCRVIRPGGAFFIYATPELAVQFAPILAEKLDFRHWIALTMKGTYPRGRKLYPAHYALLYYTKGEPRVFNKLRLPIETCRHCGGEIRDYGGHRNKMNPAGVNLTDFWTDTSPNRHKKFKVRPGVNELKLVIPERAILISTDRGDIVFDPFGGGGSTFQAAERHRRYWIGTELYDSEHILRRFEQNHALAMAMPLGLDLGKVFDEDRQNQVLRRVQGEGMPPRTIACVS